MLPELDYLLHHELRLIIQNTTGKPRGLGAIPANLLMLGIMGSIGLELTALSLRRLVVTNQIDSSALVRGRSSCLIHQT